MTKTLEAMDLMGKVVKKVSKNVERVQVQELIDSIISAEKIFVMGAGRSGLVGRAFAMRLMHLGLDVHVVGETTTPLHGENDLVITISGSGETSSIVEMGEIVDESVGTELALVTASKQSTLGGLANHVVELKGLESIGKDLKGKEIQSYAPLGTLFEVTVFVFLDGLISELMEKLGETEKDLEKRHAKLE